MPQSQHKNPGCCCSCCGLYPPCRSFAHVGLPARACVQVVFPGKADCFPGKTDFSCSAFALWKLPGFCWKALEHQTITVGIKRPRCLALPSGRGGPEQLSHLCKITQLISSKTSSQIASLVMCSFQQALLCRARREEGGRDSRKDNKHLVCVGHSCSRGHACLSAPSPRLPVSPFLFSQP